MAAARFEFAQYAARKRARGANLAATTAAAGEDAPYYACALCGTARCMTLLDACAHMLTDEHRQLAAVRLLPCLPAGTLARLQQTCGYYGKDV